MKKALIVTAVVFVLIGGVAGFVIGAASRFALFEIFVSLAPTPPLFPESNILVLGLDDAYGHRSDTIMVLHINSEKKEASVVSIPRDTLAVLPNRGLDKINHAFAYGGIELSRKTVEDFLHVNIPYYITLNLAEIEDLVDDIGGVEIDVEKRMYYTDYAGDLYIDLQPGRQRLSGKNAMGYLRFRHDDNDFARIARQQKFLRALATELIKKDNLLRSPALFMKMLSSVNTNLNSRQVMGLYMGLRGACELGQIYMTMVPGSDFMVDGIYYWKPDEAAVQRIVEQFILGKRLASSG